jgi:hypothetical protein
MISWRRNNSYASDSDTGLENWKQRLLGICTRRCERMMHALRWVGTKVREPPSFYGQNDLEGFLTNFELEVLEIQRLLVLYISLKETHAHWLGTHKEKIHYWYQ